MEGSACGAVIDTAHAFAAGYDLGGFAQARAFLDQLDAELGLGRVRMWHLNDTDFPAGSRRDRHTHLGRGFWEKVASPPWVADLRLKDMGGVMETPRTAAGPDGANLAFLRRLRRGRGAEPKGR